MPDLSNSTCGDRNEKVCCPLADDEENATMTETTKIELNNTELPTTLVEASTTPPQNESSGSSFRNRFRSFPDGKIEMYTSVNYKERTNYYFYYNFIIFFLITSYINH